MLRKINQTKRIFAWPKLRNREILEIRYGFGGNVCSPVVQIFDWCARSRTLYLLGTHTRAFDVCKWPANSNNSNRMQTTIYVFVCKTFSGRSICIMANFICFLLASARAPYRFGHNLYQHIHIHLLRAFCVYFVYNLTT